ncbi:MAG TPA: hypothetical protein G4O11_05675 [Anaerolineae bacterium]|nr:hypothetical protein [Anaerolineae bacterium]
MAALRVLLGYVPGIGLVDEAGGLRVLASPVTLEREGITVTVEQALLDSERTVIIYQADGIPPDAYPRAEDAPSCYLSPQLRLSDDSVLQIVRGQGGGWASGYESRLVYPPVPRELSEAIFFIPCLNDTSPGVAPENWEMALRFVPAPPDMTIVPVFEVSASPEATVGSDEGEEMGLHLERVIELEDSYILVGTFRQGGKLPGSMVMGISVWPEITDADGRTLPLKTPSDLDLATEEMGVFPWSYQIPKGFTAPITMTLEAVDVEFPAEATFQFDTGADPEVGQEWALNQEFDIADHMVRLVSAMRMENGYEFRFESDPSVSMVSVRDSEYEPISGSGGGYLGEFTVGFEYSPPVPTGLLTYQIAGLIARYPGPWTLTWEPPEGGEPVATLAVPQTCLTLELWSQLAENPAPQPMGLRGKLIAYGRIQDDGQPLSPANAGIFVVDLEDGSRQVLGPGTWPSLSPDGARAAYSGTDGLHVVDLDSGENRLLPGTTDFDYNPRWSPDGLQLAFVRIDDLNLYLVKADGSSMQRVTEGPEYELLIGWLPEGQTLAYVFPGPEGLQLQFMDIMTGTRRDGFVIDAKGANVAISPNGEKIAFVERVSGGMDYGLYISQLEGSDRRLIAQLGHWGLSDPRWSPDGTWLIVGITNTDLPASGAVTALIDLATCEVDPLEGIEGYVQDWSR